jgi:hypothetical protein
VREQAAQTTRDNILKAAIKVFARTATTAARREDLQGGEVLRPHDLLLLRQQGRPVHRGAEDLYRRFNEAERPSTCAPSSRWRRWWR